MQKGEEVGVVHSEAMLKLAILFEFKVVQGENIPEAGVLHQGEVVEGCQSHST
jgi:hypothetical protein